MASSDLQGDLIHPHRAHSIPQGGISADTGVGRYVMVSEANSAKARGLRFLRAGKASLARRESSWHEG